MLSAIVRTAQWFNGTISQHLNSAVGTSSWLKTGLQVYRLTHREPQSVPGHVINDGREVGGSIELHCLQALVVSFQNPLDAVAVRVVCVAVLGKTNTLRSSNKKSYFCFKSESD